MSQPSRIVESTQTGPHDDLLKWVEKHRRNQFLRPVAEHTQKAFEQTIEWLDDWKGEVILDACCGVGESTLHLAKQNPRTKVIGIDKSSARIHKHQHYAQKNLSKHVRSEPLSPEGDLVEAPNYLILQADLNDFWRLLGAYLTTQKANNSWRLVKQYILYPNPYPKKNQLGKRWHASAVFPSIIECCEMIEVRSNWKIYIEEFALAAKAYGVSMDMQRLSINSEHEAITPFERKYAASNQALWTAITLGTGCDK